VAKAAIIWGAVTSLANERSVERDRIVPIAQSVADTIEGRRWLVSNEQDELATEIGRIGACKWAKPGRVDLGGWMDL
jgi:hypothetical protein